MVALFWEDGWLNTHCLHLKVWLLFDWVIFSYLKDLSNFPFCIYSNALIKIKYPSYLDVTIFFQGGVKGHLIYFIFFFAVHNAFVVSICAKGREEGKKRINIRNKERERERKRQREGEADIENLFNINIYFWLFSFHKIEQDLEEKAESRAELFSFILDPDSNFLDYKRWFNVK